MHSKRTNPARQQRADAERMHALMTGQPNVGKVKPPRGAGGRFASKTPGGPGAPPAADSAAEQRETDSAPVHPLLGPQYNKPRVG